VENIMSSKLFTTRQGTVLLGVIAAIIAAIALIVYLNNYRNSVGANSTVRVLVAAKLIQKGTPGDVISTTSGYYEATNLPKKQVETGAIVDPASLSGKVALADISPAQQLTESDFGTATSSVVNQLGSNQRAVVVSLGSPESVGGQIGAGSHVDVWATTSQQASNGANSASEKLLYQNMYVLNASTNGGNVTLRTSPQQAGVIIYAAQNSHIWLALRPTIATVTKSTVVGPSNLAGH
jgi:Flp pilus assembly protein CpaB